MKKLTVSVDDEVYRRARIKAAEEGTSVSALVKAFLVQICEPAGTESNFERLKRQERALRASISGLSSTDNLSRDQLHDRDALR